MDPYPVVLSVKYRYLYAFVESNAIFKLPSRFAFNISGVTVIDVLVPVLVVFPKINLDDA